MRRRPPSSSMISHGPLVAEPMAAVACAVCAARACDPDERAGIAAFDAPTKARWRLPARCAPSLPPVAVSEPTAAAGCLRAALAVAATDMDAAALLASRWLGRATAPALASDAETAPAERAGFATEAPDGRARLLPVDDLVARACD